MGKWGFGQNNIPLKEVALDNSSLSGASLGAPSPDKSAFAPCIRWITSFQTAPFTDCALCYHYSFIQGLSWWNRHPPASSFNHAITIRRRHLLFDFLFSSTMAKRKRKKKNEATHFLLNSARKILHWTIYHLLRTITRMNKTIKTEEKATLSSSWSTQSL